MGRIKKTGTGFALDEALRFASASGGVSTALLTGALERGLIQGAVVTRTRLDAPTQAESSLIRIKEEIVGAQTSKYCPSSPAGALRGLKNTGARERFAFVGLPCHIHALRKFQQMEPWALEMLVDWHTADPVSLKERERNAAVFAYQGNRNPFIDRPEFVGLVYQTAAAVDDGALAAASHGDVPRLLTSITQAHTGGALIRFHLPADAEITLDLWDVGGRRIAELAAGPHTAGPAEILWDGRLRDGGLAGSGVYFITLRTPLAATRGRLLLLR